MQKEVIVYHQPNCSACHAAMNYLKQKGITFVAKDVFADKQAQRELTALGSTSTPTIKVGNEVLYGFSPSKLSKLLQS